MSQELSKMEMNLEDIFSLNHIEDKYKEKYWTVYNYQGKPIPRVSQILTDGIYKPFLTTWAAKVGEKKMKETRDTALLIGSRVHEMIEYYLKTNKVKDVSYKTAPMYMKSIQKAFHNFQSWIEKLHKYGCKIDHVYAIEQPVSCPYYGGTVDCIAQINGANYILDWKTSKRIDYSYIIQTIAYMICINQGYVKDLPHIDGIGIVRVDKESDSYQDFFLNYFIPEQKAMIDEYIKGFGFILGSFYHKLDMEQLFYKYKKETDTRNTLERGQIDD